MVGWILAVANDWVPNFLYRNRHDGTLEEIGLASGFALNDDGRAQAFMGIAVGDYNREGRVDFYLSSFSDDYNVSKRRRRKFFRTGLPIRHRPGDDPVSGMEHGFS
jgi:hypothetical protein